MFDIITPISQFAYDSDLEIRKASCSAIYTFINYNGPYCLEYLISIFNIMVFYREIGIFFK